MFITVLTTTYNRAKLLPRAFESLKKQDFADFNWLIIDDGSNDNTKDVVESLKKDSDFEIIYKYKENGGKHTAINFALDIIESEYFVILDSDDIFTDDALKLIKKNIDEIPVEKADRIWAITGRCKYFDSGDMVGLPYDLSLNKLSGRKFYKKLCKYPGEKQMVFVTDKISKYRFPIYNDTKFVTESTLWDTINKDYDQYLTNDLIRVYYTDSEDSLVAGKIFNESRKRTFYYSALFNINENFYQFFWSKKILFSLVNISRCAMMSNQSYNSVMKDINKWYKKVMVSLGYPISWLWIISNRRKLK